MIKLQLVSRFFLSTLVVICCSCDVAPLLLSNESVETYDFNYDDSDLPPAMHINPAFVHEVTLSSGDDDVAISAIYVGELTAVAVTDVIYYLHGNAPNLTSYWDHISRLVHAGGRHKYSIFAIDYRGFGKSDGSLTTDGWIDDVQAGLQWLHDQGVTPTNLTVYGYSLGGLAAIMAAAEPSALQTERLILDAPFPGADAPLQAGTGLSIEGSFFSTIGEYDGIEAISRYDGGLLWLHAKDDATVPFAHGQSVYDAHAGPQEFSNPATGDHLVVDGLGLAAYQALIDAYIQQ